MKNVIRVIGLLALALSHSQLSVAEVLFDDFGDGTHIIHIDNFSTQAEAFAKCNDFDSKYRPTPSSPGGCGIMGVSGSPSGLMVFDGWYQNSTTGNFDVATYYINNCVSPAVYNVATGACGVDEQKGAPPINSCVANPINVAIGCWR